MLENTKNLFTQLKDKQSFIMLCSTEFEIKPLSIRNNWFSGKYKQVPKNNQTEVLRILQRSIELFNLTPQLK